MFPKIRNPFKAKKPKPDATVDSATEGSFDGASQSKGLTGLFSTKGGASTATSMSASNEPGLVAISHAVVVLPKNVRTWSTIHVDRWLCDVFSGADALPKYREAFRKIGVRGVDLLESGNSNTDDFGIKEAIHKQRFKLAVNELIEQEKTLNNDVRFRELTEECNTLRQKNPPYKLPKKVAGWTPVDVVFFLSQDKYSRSLGKFVKPIANKTLDGKEILEMIEKTPETWELTGLSVKEEDAQKLRTALKNFEDDQEKEALRLKESRRKQVESLHEPVIYTSNVVLGSGYYASAYLAKYKKKNVVVKILKTKDNKAIVKDESGDDIYDEAAMLLRAAGPGVLRLIGVTSDKPPRLVTEYMCNLSVESEFQLYTIKKSSDSIFDSQNEGNLQQADQGIADPVTLQRVRIARDVAVTLARLHSIGIIHLDLAARNIFLDAGKRPKIGDFGHAEIVEDMVEMHALVKQAPIMADNKLGNIDAAALKRYQRARPIRYLPTWVVDCGSAPRINPLLDTHADVYAFGCFMYEMQAFQEPHKNISDEEEIKSLKASRRGNPSVPHGTNATYARIMTSCWKDYDAQPSMEQLAQHLSDLHRQLLCDAIDENDAIREVRDLSAAMSISAQRLSVVYGSVGSVQAKQAAAASTGASGGNSAAPKSLPKLQEGRIRLLLPEGIDANDVPKLYEFQSAGISKQQLSDAHKNAFLRKESTVIANCMMCIRVEDAEPQIAMIIACLNYITQLAGDEHGDVDEVAATLCEQIATVVQKAIQITPGGALFEISRTLIVNLATSALGAIGAILKHCLAHDAVGLHNQVELSNQLFSISLCMLKSFSADAVLVEKAADAIGLLCVYVKSNEAQAVQLLLDAIAAHKANASVLVACAGALKRFPIACLASPRTKFTDRTPAAGGTAAKRLTAELGEVTRSLLRSIHGRSAGTDGEDEKVVEACLRTLYEACELSPEKPELIQRLLFCITEEEIKAVFDTLAAFPDNFRIQDGAAGLLVHILDTGMGVEEQEEDSRGRPVSVIVEPVTPSADRLAVILKCDPEFAQLMESMTSFSVNDQNLLQPRRVNTGRKPNAAVSKATYSSYSKLRSQTATRTAQSATTYTEAGATRSIGQHLKDVFDEEIRLVRQVDSDGNEVTAATLQKSIAMIIGFACNGSKQAQEVVYQSNFSAQLLVAFRNFRSYIPLLQYGCHALFSACRTNLMMQRGLHNQHVVNRLCEALDTHSDVPDVADGMIVVLTGLLEPPNKRLKVSEREQFDSYRVASAIVGDIHDKNADSVFAILAKTAVRFVTVPECHQLISNFMLLLAALLFWRPDCAKVWKTKLLVFDTKEDATNFAELVAKLLGRAKALSEPSRTASVNAASISGARDGPQQEPTPPAPVPTADVAAQASSTAVPATPPPPGPTAAPVESEEARTRQVSTANGGGSLNLVDQRALQRGDVTRYFGDHEDHTKKAAGTALVVLVTLVLDLHEFVTIASEIHRSQCHVVGAGLALVTLLLQHSKPEATPFGGEMPYASDEALYTLRKRLVMGGFVDLTIMGLKVLDGSSTDNVLRIRHTLWVSLLLISEQKQSDINFNRYSASKISSDLEPLIKWSMTVMQEYPDCYSLQCLSVMFLLWMEQHGHLHRDMLTMKRLHTYLPEVLARPVDSYRPVDEECYDPSLFGMPSDMFGKLNDHVGRLILLLNIHLKKGAPTVELSTWNGRCCPYTVSVVACEFEDDPVSKHRYNTYVVEVKWDDKLQWTIAKRFSFFLDLQAALAAEFTTINPIDDKLIKPGKTILTTRSQDSRQECRATLDRWMQRLVHHRAVLLHKVFLNFIDAYTRVPRESLREVALLPFNEQPAKSEHPITCIAYDAVRDLFFVGSGLMQGALARLFSKVQVAGIVSVYSSSPGDGRPALQQLKFSAAVLQIAWEPSCRVLCVGMATGAILCYQLTEAAPYTLSYLCEHSNSHTHPTCIIALDPDLRAMYSASAGGLIESFSTFEGKIISQTNCKAPTIITAVAVVAANKWIVCGTNTQMLQFYDMSQSAGKCRSEKKLLVPREPGANNPLPVSVVTFVDETSTLYAAVNNFIFCLRLPVGVDSDEWGEEGQLLALKGNVRITEMLAISRGNYLVVTSGSEGSVSIIDMKPKFVPQTTEKTESIVPQLKTSAAELVPWTEAVTYSNAQLRSWFQGHGVNAAGALTRSELLKLLTKTQIQGQTISAKDIADALTPEGPAKEVLFVYTLREPRDARVYITSIALIENLRALALGCVDGSVQLLSLADFLPPESMEEKQDAGKHYASKTYELKGSRATSGKALQL